MPGELDGSPTTPFTTPRPPHGPRAVVLVVDGPLSPEVIATLCARLRHLLHATDVDIVTCDVGAIADPDLAAVEAVARLQLTATRLGRSIRLGYASGELRDLLRFAGLEDVVPYAHG